MGLHHQSNHGRVLRGVDAKNHLQKQKRDSHGTNIKLNVPKYLQAAARPADALPTKYANKAAVETIESVVYVTVSADFTGAIAGYTTLTDVTATSTAVSATNAQSTVAVSTATVDPEASYVSAKSAASARGSSASTGSSSTKSVFSVTNTGPSPTRAATSATSSISSSSSADGHDNKSVFLNAPASVTSTAAASVTLVGNGVQATRVAQTSSTNNAMTSGAKAGLAVGILMAFALAGGLLFFCWRRRKNPAAHEEILDEKRASSTFGGKNMSEKRVSDRSSHTASTAPRLSLRPVTNFLPALGSNRKSSGSVVDAMSEKPKSMWERRANPAENPFGDAAASSEKEPQNPFDEPEGMDGARPKSEQLGAAAVTAAPAKDVHRVQLDFKPSMEDELELKSGQLVRMLHEYDDGWALCIRMDRSQQGVAPRTCLSKMPVKPRPQSPQSSDARPMTPSGPSDMIPRPLTPTSRDHTSSDAGVEHESTSNGLVVPTSKPVPGQAL